MFTVLPSLEILIRTLKPSQRIDLKKWLDLLIQADILNAKDLAELVRQFHPQIKCPHCFAQHVIKHGVYRTWQRYKCKKCLRTFNDLTGTPFHYLHDHDKVKVYLRIMFNKEPLRKIAQKVEIHLPRAFYWRHKFLHAFQSANCTFLKELIQADDTYFALSYKGRRHLEIKIGRKPYKRGHSCKKRGISSEKVAVIAAIDKNHNRILQLGGRGKITNRMVMEALSPRIA